MGEDLGPGLNLDEVISDVFALSQVSWEFSDDNTELLNSLDHSLDVSLGEISESIGDLNLEDLGVGKAFLDLWEVILLDEAVHDTGDEFFGTFDVHFVVSGNDAGSCLNESHFS